MPFVRRSRFRRSIRSRRPRRGLSGLARQVRRLTRVAGHPELKNVDNSTALTDLDDVPVITPISTIVQGDTVSTRDGNRVTLQSLYFRWTAVVPSASPADSIVYRYWIVQDKRPNGTAMTTTPFLDSGDVMSLNNLETAGRFKVWRDVTKVFGDLTTSGSRVPSIHQGHVYIKFKKPILQVYDGATGVPTAGSHFYLVQVSTVPQASTGISTNFETRFRFIDN